MHAEIVSIGTEILMGEIVDTNSGYLASELPKVGIELRWVSKVGDDPDRLFEVIDRAWRRSDVTFTTGGLGPTTDDMTRETIARVVDEPMAVQEELLEHLKSFFAGRGTSMPETNVKQATLIPSADTVPNPMGTAPGWWVEKDGHIIVAMPGPPRELERMWTAEVAPKLEERNPGVAIATRTLKTYGISEGGLDEMVSPLFESANPSLGIYSREDGIHLRAIATAPTEEQALELIAPMEAQIRGVVGDSIWGEDDETAETQLASLLTQRGLTVGIMESFTGGLLTSRLADLSSSDRFLKGSVVALDEGVLQGHGVDRELMEGSGPISATVAEAMARAAFLRFDADAGVGVTGLATEPTSTGDPAGTCYIGFALGDRTASVLGRYPTDRSRMRGRAVTHVLLELLRFLKA